MQNKSPGYRISLPFELLKTFTEKELNSFEKLIASGYLGVKQEVGMLLKSLKKHALHHADFTPLIQCAVYNGLSNNEKKAALLNEQQKKKLSKAMNTLLFAAEKFLMFERIKDTNEHDTTLLYPALIDRKQILLYSRRLKATERKLNKVKKQGLEYHNQCYRIQKEKSDLLFRNNAIGKEDNYDVLQYHTDVKYLLEKLQYHLAKITALNIHPDKKFDFSPYYACKALFNLPQYQQNPLVQLYQLNIDLVQKADDKTYHLLLNALQQFQKNIPTSFLRPFYVNLNNYCAIQLARGKLKFYENLWFNYKTMHQNNLLIRDKTIDIAILKNMVTVACRLKKFSWASKILEDNISHVDRKIRNSVHNFNKGAIEFYQQSYDEAQLYFVKVRKIDDSHFIALKIFFLQCFYETDEGYEATTQQMLDSLRVFFSVTKKMNKPVKTSYKNFVAFFSKLYKLKQISLKQNKQLVIEKTLPFLTNKIINEKLIWQKKWLLEKIEILKGK